MLLQLLSHFATAWAWGGFESFWDPVRWRNASWRWSSTVLDLHGEGTLHLKVASGWACGILAVWLTTEQERKSDFSLLGIIQKSYLTISSLHTMNFKLSQCKSMSASQKENIFLQLPIHNLLNFCKESSVCIFLMRHQNAFA